MWILIWAYVSTSGVLTSGTIDFPTKEACEAGKRSWGTLTAEAIEEARQIGHLRIGCVQRATGTP